MKRLVLAAAVAMAGNTVAGSGVAQDLHKSPYEERLSRFREEKPRVPSAQHLIFERAQIRAQHRAARLESFRWMGYSPTRSTVPYTAYSTDLNPALMSPSGHGYKTWYGRW